jgi:TolB-like protein/DNA-binding winged helix-turn-helix (wHTH) protein
MQTDSLASHAESGPPQVFTFGPFEVNVRTGELRKHGSRLSLQEQPLRILAALLERPGEAVSREDLCKRLWPMGTGVDCEHSLNAAVRRLRVALGDDAETPRFIETVHRRGYRFLIWGITAVGARSGVKPTPAFATTLGSFRSVARFAPRQMRLAVLPFAVFARSDDEREQSGQCSGGSGGFGVGFEEGLTEETTTQLARTCPRHVGVLARTSVMRLSCSERSAAEAGRMLGADYLVEGSIRREGNRLRIVAQLIESQEETHLWAATFDRVVGGARGTSGDRMTNGDRAVVTDWLTVQTEVAQQIVRGVVEALSERKTAAGF